MAAGAVVAALVLAALAGAFSGASSRRGGSTPGATTDGGPAASAVGTVLAARALPWRLPAALSRAVALARGGRLLVLGGLDAAQRSTATVLSIDPRSGSVRRAGALSAPTHDAAGAILGGRALVFGGGSSTSTAAVQDAGRVRARLPRARSDLSSATIGARAYLIGGYDGQTSDPAVLATADGRRFETIARLPVPVRYAAVAASGGAIYAFGGMRPAGATAAIQRVDPRTGRARVAGRLPEPIAHAAAVALGGSVYVLGGRARGIASDRIWRFDPASGAVKPAGHLPVAVSDAGVARVGDTAYLVGGEDTGALASVVSLRLEPAARAQAGAPFAGRLLIADRGNNRLLLVDSAKRVLWRYPSRSRPAPRGGFYFPDDAFFIRHGTGIISNEEENHTIVELGFPSGRVLWRYGHPRQPGSRPGYLDQPDDAYLLRNGVVTVADAKNCRILFISPRRRPLHQIGTTGRCVHQPPRGVGYPNGDTPLANGDVLISEINGSYVDEYTPAGRLVWSVKLALAYPSDPQQLGPDRYLVADYHRPGGVYEFNRAGRILWSYHPRSGPGMLDHPSLAERLPGGLIGVNDDYRHRVVLIDPRTDTIVWQYGATGRRGRRGERLAIPDGFDLLQRGGRAPTHPQTG